MDAVFEEIASLMKVSSRPRQMEALQTILLNLIHAHHLDKPVRYSRDKNRYTRDRRYRLDHYTYDRLIPIIDALERLGYIEQSSHYNDPESDKYGLQTRMWGTDRLWARVREYGLTHPFGTAPRLPEEKEVIVLRNEDKQDVGYRETRQTRQMRDDLERYNYSLRKHRISVKLTGDDIVDNRWLVENLCESISKGKVWIRYARLNSKHHKYRYVLPIQHFTKHLIPSGRNPYKVIQDARDRIPAGSDSIPITHTKRWKALLDVLLRRFWSEAHFFEKDLHKRSIEIGRIPWDERQKVLALEFRLRDLGVDELEIVLDHEHLRRIFNRESWKLGGRAYGAYHQFRLRKPMRKNILIDGQPTIELDYAGFHPRMLYHLEGIDYQDDPYVVCEGPEMRDIYKAVSLIAINTTEKKASGAIRKELDERGLVPPKRDKPYASLVRGFKQAHPAIAHHLFSDVGVSLQNIDSRIMNAILVRLMDNDILGLPVHDSVIIQQQHETFAREVMTQEYKNEMGYKPKF
ncbi:hypothetical protein JCM12296A_51710 [Desulfosarcina cetonica]